MFRADMEANLSAEVSMIVLDIVSLHAHHFKVRRSFMLGGRDEAT